MRKSRIAFVTSPVLSRALSLYALAVLLFAGLCGAARAQNAAIQPPPEPPLPAGVRAWNFSSHTLSGKPFTLRSLRGHVTIVDFWATWCPPCRMSIPGMERIYRQYRSRGLRVVGISMDTGSEDAVAPFAHSAHMTYTVALDPEENAIAARHYHVETIPSFFILDRNGVVRWSFSGYYDGLDSDIKAHLNKLLSWRG